MMNRRSLLRTLGAGLVAGAGSSPVAGSHDSGETLRIGVMQPLSGGLEQFGRLALEGFYTGFGYFGGNVPADVTGNQQFTVGDLTVEVAVRDTEAQPERAAQQALELAADADADILVGGLLAPSALQIAERAAEYPVPYLAGPAGVPSLTNSTDTCSEFVFRASEPSTATARAGAQYIADESQAGSVFIFHADYQFGRDTADAYEQILTRRGVSVAGRRALQPGYNDWEQPYQEAVDAGADTIISAFSISTLPRMLSAYLQTGYPFRFHTALNVPLTLQTLGQVISDNIDPLTAAAIDDAGMDPVPTIYHWNQYDNEIARRATRIHRDSYGRNPGTFSSGMFATASAIVQAVSATGSTELSDITNALRGMTINATMKGENQYRFQDYNNQARSPVTVAPLIPRESSQESYWEPAVQPGQPVWTSSMDVTTLGPDEVSCSLGSVQTTPTPDSPTPTPPPQTATPTPERATPTPEYATSTPETATPQQPSDTQTSRPTETPASTVATSTAAENSSDDGSLFDGTPSATGDLGPMVGVAGVLGGIGASWLVNRDEDDE